MKAILPLLLGAACAQAPLSDAGKRGSDADELAIAVIAGSPDKQLRYHEKLFGLAQEKRFLFVDDFIHQDYDRLWERIEASSPELFMAWRDCGLLDETGKPRPALDLWRRWLAVPLGG